ncbi:MAG: AAA family ATPase [Blautia faecis]
MCHPRRFGKSMAADMLASYYEKEENSDDLFGGLRISRAITYRNYLNQYDVIKINMQEFFSVTSIWIYKCNQHDGVTLGY